MGQNPSTWPKHPNRAETDCRGACETRTVQICATRGEDDVIRTDLSMDHSFFSSRPQGCMCTNSIGEMQANYKPAVHGTKAFGAREGRSI